MQNANRTSFIMLFASQCLEVTFTTGIFERVKIQFMVSIALTSKCMQLKQ